MVNFFIVSRWFEDNIIIWFSLFTKFVRVYDFLPYWKYENVFASGDRTAFHDGLSSYLRPSITSNQEKNKEKA